MVVAWMAASKVTFMEVSVVVSHVSVGDVDS